MAPWLRWLLVLTTAQAEDEDVGLLFGLRGLPGVRLCSNFTFGFHQAARRGLDANKRYNLEITTKYVQSALQWLQQCTQHLADLALCMDYLSQGQRTSAANLSFLNMV